MAKTTAVDLEVTPTKAVCRLCGTGFGTHNGYFYRNYGQIYKATGYMHVCKRCVDALYEDYLRESGDTKLACHQVCRKFNIYWNETIYNGVVLGSSTRSMMSGYLTRANIVKYRGKSYDDYLREIGMLWDIPQKRVEEELTPTATVEKPKAVESEPEEEIEVADEIKIAWGIGYTNKQYVEFEERLTYWKDKLMKKNVDPDDIDVDSLLRQIVPCEIDIAKRRAEGLDVDKQVNTLHSLINSAILKPSQKKSDADVSLESTPFGVWLARFENEKPLPKDENESAIKKFVHTWLYGHLGKMLGLRNTYTQLYEDEMERLRVERPEYADEEDDIILTDVFGDEVFENE